MDRMTLEISTTADTQMHLTSFFVRLIETTILDHFRTSGMLKGTFTELEIQMICDGIKDVKITRKEMVGERYYCEFEF